MYKRLTDAYTIHNGEGYPTVEYYNNVKKKGLLIKDGKIHKPYRGKSIYMKIKKLYEDILHKFSFVPRMEFDDENLIIIEEYIKDELTKENKPPDYVEQLRSIDDTFKKHSLYHNDLNQKVHIRVKDNKIYIIDFDMTTIDKPKIFSREWLDVIFNTYANDMNHVIKKYKN